MIALRSSATGAAILYVVAEFARYYAKMQEFCAWWTVACMRDDCWVSGSRFFIWRLVAAFPKHVVLAQVSLSQLLGVQKGTTNRQAVANRFRQLCADFVICDRSFTTVGALSWMVCRMFASTSLTYLLRSRCGR